MNIWQIGSPSSSNSMDNLWEEILFYIAQRTIRFYDSIFVGSK